MITSTPNPTEQFCPYLQNCPRLERVDERYARQYRASICTNLDWARLCDEKIKLEKMFLKER